MVLQSRTDGSHAEAVAGRRIPAVTVNYLNAAGLPEVSADYEGSVEEAHRLLVEQGARRIAFLCPRLDCQPNHRMVVRHAELARRLAGTAELVHVDLDGFPSVADAWREAVADGGYDGFVVDGVPNGVEVARLAAADGGPVGRRRGLVMFRHRRAGDAGTRRSDPALGPGRGGGRRRLAGDGTAARGRPGRGDDARTVRRCEGGAMKDTAKLAMNGGPKVRTAPWPERGLVGVEEKRAVDALFDDGDPHGPGARVQRRRGGGLLP